MRLEIKVMVAFYAAGLCIALLMMSGILLPSLISSELPLWIIIILTVGYILCAGMVIYYIGNKINLNMDFDEDDDKA
jgi:hypothetical protein